MRAGLDVLRGPRRGQGRGGRRCCGVRLRRPGLVRRPPGLRAGRRRPGRVRAQLAAAGFARWTVTEEPVDVGLTEPADVVRYRLGVPHLHRFVARLPDDVRDGLLRRRGRGGPPDRRTVRAGRRRGGRGGLAQPGRSHRRNASPRSAASRATCSASRIAVVRAYADPVASATSAASHQPSSAATPARASRSAARRDSSTGVPEPRLCGRADQPGQHGVTGVTALLGSGGHRLRRVERGRGVLLGQREPGQEQPSALVEPPLVVEPPGTRSRLGDRQPVGGTGQVAGAEQAVGHVELALGPDLLAVRQLESGARELLGGRVAEVAQQPAPVGVREAGVPQPRPAPLDLALEQVEQVERVGVRPSSP